MNTKINYLNDELLSKVSGGIRASDPGVIARNAHVIVLKPGFTLMTETITSGHDPESGLSWEFVSINPVTPKNANASAKAPNVYLNPPAGAFVVGSVGVGV